jgi:hypothetical protein
MYCNPFCLVAELLSLLCCCDLLPSVAVCIVAALVAAHTLDLVAALLAALVPVAVLAAVAAQSSSRAPAACCPCCCPGCCHCSCPPGGCPGSCPGSCPCCCPSCCHGSCPKSCLSCWLAMKWSNSMAAAARSSTAKHPHQQNTPKASHLLCMCGILQLLPDLVLCGCGGGPITLRLLPHSIPGLSVGDEPLAHTTDD